MKSTSFTVPERWGQVHSAQARVPADLLVRECRIINVYSGEIHPGDIAIKDGIFVAIRERYDGTAVVVMDGGGRFAVPGFVFSHGLPDSGRSPDPDQGQLGLTLGVTSVVGDLTAGPLESGVDLPQRQWTATRLGLPPGSQTPAVARNESEALVSLRSGFPTFLQPGTGNASIPEILGRLGRGGVDTGRACLGRWNQELGGMPAGVLSVLDLMRDATSIGRSPVAACAMATLNPAIIFGLDHRIGSITPGRFADFWLTESLGSPRPSAVFVDGKPAGP